MTFGPDGNLYLTSPGMNSPAVRVDGITGELLGVFAQGHGLSRPYSLIFIPEPGSLALLACGALAGLIWWRRRR